MRLLLPTILAVLGASLLQAQGPHDDHYHAGSARCGTPVWMAAHAEGATDKERRLLASLACDRRTVKSNSTLSSEGHFRIHYDITGPDAVDPRDLNDNQIPDYIDSVDFYMELAWDVEIDQFEFAPPPPDRAGPGNEVDVFICELSASYYGYAIPEPDNPTGSNTVSGFLVLDNDYIGYPTPGIKGLRVTSAHEFHHIVQFSSYRYDLTQSSIYEATSVWFERKAHPDIPDYRQYTDSLIRFPQNYGFSTNSTTTTVTGYAHVLYMDYVEKRFGRDVVRRMWEEFRTRNTEWESIDAALRTRGGNLPTSYCEFAEWAYRTGNRADTAFFPDAAEFPTMRAVVSTRYEGTPLALPVSLYPLSFALIEIALPTGTIVGDTIDILLTNARSDFGKGTPTLPRDRFTIEIERDGGVDFRPIRGDGDSIFYRIVDPGGESCSKVIVGGRPIVYVATTASPQPFVVDGAERMVIPIPTTSESVTSARMWLYTSSMRPVTTVEQQGLIGANGLLGVVWDGRGSDGSLVSSGVYVYELEINGTSYSVGKIAVVRK